ncbi:hypothetical protein LZ198_17875 [Myxococcus sp. K15C18031901]|uniref:hypothetical protein n=1 Tax=Myxococcus dinghuensis TaxID=2906761 RepID=UPI0020A6F88E|nr:hypothetical protein [Myxococcus dinghuensis]MCP3100741.1 hypothetical protein [Myxococcus dinghuensis]
MVNGATRHVETIRLTARTPALVRRGAVLLEDALRTASFPEAGRGRVLVIRRLPVGIIQGHLPPSSVALALERVVRELAASAVHAEEPSAPHQDAVFFHDDAEPPLALARRLVRGEPALAWFWPLAVADFAPARARDEQLRRTLAAALASSAGLGAAARLVETLNQWGGLDVLLGALRRSDGAALLQVSGGAPPTPADVNRRRGDIEAGLGHAALRSTVERWAADWGPADARSVWLAAMALVVERRARLADSGLFERAARLAAGLTPPTETAEASHSARAITQADAARPDAAPATFEDGATGVPLRGSSPGAASPVTSTREEPPERASAPPANPTSPPAGPVDAAARDAGARPRTPTESRRKDDAPSEPTTRPDRLTWPETPMPTKLGGLLFLIPVLERLGFPALLDAAPSLIEAEVPERLFGAIARRLGATGGDATLALFGAPALGAAPRGLEFDLERVLRGLRVAVRRWCLRQGGLGLRALAVRPARIMATRTHLDVLLDIRHADLRARRLGLDLDPGWVPWLGRVVRFHYLYGEG